MVNGDEMTTILAEMGKLREDFGKALEGVDGRLNAIQLQLDLHGATCPYREEISKIGGCEEDAKEAKDLAQNNRVGHAKLVGMLIGCGGLGGALGGVIVAAFQGVTGG